MIVSDTAFLPALRRSLARQGLSDQAARRIDAAAGADRDAVRSLISRVDGRYVSPLCRADMKKLVPSTMPLFMPRTHLSQESVASIQAMLMFGNARTVR